MRICLDLDGVVCRVREPGVGYADVEPIPGAIEMIRRLRAAGHVMILHTARHMQTCGGNVGGVIARQGKVTLDWLERHGVEFDEIHFGKPIADVYVDDNGHRFSSWCDPSLLEVGIAPLDPDLLDALGRTGERAA